jgi:hypothetical protein
LIFGISDNSKIIIITNRTQAKILSQLVEINGDASREALIARLPVNAVGGTCIGCGLQKALDVSYTLFIITRQKFKSNYLYVLFNQSC